MKIFISGTTKISDKESKYYRLVLPKDICNVLDQIMTNDWEVIIGDAAGIDTMVQTYLYQHNYKKVIVYATDKVRNNVGNWACNIVDGRSAKDEREYHALKDKEMQDICDFGYAVLLDNGGARATRANVKALDDMGKFCMVYELKESK